LVIVAFIAGLIYLAVHSTDDKSIHPTTGLEVADTVGSITPDAEGFGAGAAEPAVPIPRPRPKLRSDNVGPPLQIVPQQ
jgi:hypothetical protein